MSTQVYIGEGRERPRLSCVVVNWNGWQDTLECLDSLRHQDYPALEIIVVDNGSTNDSVERIREAHPSLALIETGRNLGFPGGCNIGIRRAYQRGADLLWILNNDTVSPPDTASKLVAAALAHPEAGAIGSVLYYRHDPARVQAWGGGKLHLLTGYVSHFTAPASFERPTSFLTGASIVLPRHICEEVGILDESFFLYGDDSDLCLRIRAARYALVVAEGTAILHREGGSSPRRSARVDELATTSTLRLLRRHSPLPLLSLPLYLGLRLMNRVRRREWANLAAVWRGALVFWGERGRVFANRL